MRRLLLFLAPVVACKPDFDERVSIVDDVRILAVRAEPSEAAPFDEAVTYSLLVVGFDGFFEVAASFSYCVTPKRLTENGAVSASCQQLKDGVVLPIGDAIGGIAALIPPEACFSFGPEVREAGLRPRDPDPTGGFYQPVRAVVLARDGSPRIAFGFERLRCKLANAPADQVTIFTRDYARNVNPTLAPLEAWNGSTKLAFDAIPRGARVTLRATWRPEDAERYVAFDPRAQLVVPRREAMRVSWYATGGVFEHDRTGRDEADLATTSDNTWTAPDAAKATLWAVLRDSRGGVGFHVQPVGLR